MIDLRDYQPTERGTLGAQVSDNWWMIRDGDPQAREMYELHYSSHQYKDGRRPKLFVGPGHKIVMAVPILTQWGYAYAALIAFRDFRDQSGETGVNVAIFRNEFPELIPARSSELITEAEEVVRMSHLMPHRFYTYVNPGKIKSRNPGFCFKKAGYRKTGTTTKGLHILAKEL